MSPPPWTGNVTTQADVVTAVRWPTAGPWAETETDAVHHPRQHLDASVQLRELSDNREAIEEPARLPGGPGST